MKTGKRIAIIVLVLCMLTSVLFLGGRKLEGYRDRQLDTFFEGVDGDGLCIYNDLMARQSAAHNLLTIAGRYLTPTDAAVTAVKDAIVSLDAAIDVEEYFQANYDLTLASTTLYNALTSADLSDKDARLLSEQFTEMSARNMTISHDGYNAVARAFNRMLEGFPTAVIALVNGVGEMDEFR